MAYYVQRNRTLLVPTILLVTDRVLEDGDIFVAGRTLFSDSTLHVTGDFQLDPIRPDDFAQATGDMHFLAVTQGGEPIFSIDGLNLPVSDFLTNGVSDAQLFGGDDRMIGARGPQFMDGMGGDDLMRGKAGNDRLTGGAGDDVLFGDAGDDKLTGGDGRDRLTGGEGVDQFRFDDADGVDRVMDFRIGVDRLVFEGMRHESELSMRASGDALVISYGETQVWVMGAAGADPDLHDLL